MTTEEVNKKASKPLDMTETLVFIIVDYMLDNDGYGFFHTNIRICCN